jgi:hypothetical protein
LKQRWNLTTAGLSGSAPKRRSKNLRALGVPAGKTNNYDTIFFTYYGFNFGGRLPVTHKFPKCYFIAISRSDANGRVYVV